MEIGLIRKIDIEEEMQQSYLDYAMSVIVSRALPDARDGLKPVHRRILYAMHDMGIRPDSSYKKSARIVGEVLGKYHPHGDMAVYDAMARMAQDFSMRYQLVDGQGNFGSMDGDSPAAMRYTEARMAQLATHMLSDIDKATVDFSTNFDDTLNEPNVLPAALPNLLVNGITGIAVGMSTSIPPHNLSEVMDALIYMLENWKTLDDISVEDLMKFIKGPDFPTGGIVIDQVENGGLQKAYGSGRGRIRVRARAHIEEMSRGRHRIVVTEIPYMVNKTTLLERIATLAREEKIEGIADLRDESDRQGVRVVIELTKTADPESVLEDLYKYSSMRTTFSLIMLALVEGEPRLLNLKQALRVYLNHRLEIIKRRSEFELERARKREHILSGLMLALANLDEVIDIIRKSRRVDTAKQNLRKRFKLSDDQAMAILDMPLRRLAALERQKIEQEYKVVKAKIRALVALLKSPIKMRQVIADELQAVKETYGDPRRTQIVSVKGDVETIPVRMSSLAPDTMVWVSVTSKGIVSRTTKDARPRISGSAAPKQVIRANTRDTLYLVTVEGQAASLPVLSIPETDKPENGLPFHQVSSLSEKEKIAGLLSLPAKDQLDEGWFVISVTRQGMLKKTGAEEFPGPAATPFTLVKVNDGDSLGWIQISDGQKDILLTAASGMAIRFTEEDVRPMGLVAAGVMGIKLGKGDEVVGAELIPQRGEVLLIASDGRAKRVKQEDFPVQGRYGKGVIAWKLPAGKTLVGCVIGTKTKQVTLHLKKYAAKLVTLGDAPLQTRVAVKGKSVLEVRSGDQILDMTVPWDVPRPLKKSK
ncbi:MAG: DNA gyrase subunit A [Anaerolineales bacterium]|nr:DNA gyrase subunit A [Chloroflexota bacterium]MBL6981338.1 DNA gyrase subunit A [Anaerolineales bacterium]